MRLLSKPLALAVVVFIAIWLLVGCSGESATFVATAGTGQSSSAEAFVDDLFSGDYYRPAMRLETAFHAAAVSDTRHEADLYSFEGDFPDRGRVLCGFYSHRTGGDGGASGTCADSLDPAPSVSQGFSGTSGSDDGEHVAPLFFAPAGAASFEVHTSGGDTLTANVINRTSFVAWTGSSDEYIEQAVVFDQEGTKLWERSDFEQDPFDVDAQFDEADSAEG